jgi:hypothetical protein
MLVPYLRSVLFSLDRIAGASDKITRGWAVFKSFLSSLKITVDDVTYGIEISPERGAADSGDLEIDLPNLFIAIGELSELLFGQFMIRAMPESRLRHGNFRLLKMP